MHGALFKPLQKAIKVMYETSSQAGFSLPNTIAPNRDKTFDLARKWTLKITKLRQLIIFSLYRWNSHSCCWTIDVAYSRSFVPYYLDDSVSGEYLPYFEQFPLFKTMCMEMPPSPPHLLKYPLSLGSRCQVQLKLGVQELEVKKLYEESPFHGGCC